MSTSNKDANVAGFGQLPAAVVADVFRRMAYPQQVLDASIQPLSDDWKICGRAFTHSNLPARPGDKSMSYEAEDSWSAGDVIVESYWGAFGINFADGARNRKCVGAVVDGPYRDIPAHLRDYGDFPVFCRRGLDVRSSNPGGSHRAFLTRWMHAYNVPINCAGVRVEPGDIVLGDADGVVVIPREVEGLVLGFASSLEEAENELIAAKRNGMSSQEAQRITKVDWPAKSGLAAWLKSR